MKNYTRFEHEDMMFSFNYDGIVTGEVLVAKLTDFISSMPNKIAFSIGFNLKVHEEAMLREEERETEARRMANLSSNDDDLPF